MLSGGTDLPPPNIHSSVNPVKALGVQETSTPAISFTTQFHEMKCRKFIRV